jgi:broad specificity phosphatase PhoE
MLGRLDSLATRVIIVRHGQSSYNAQQKIQGRSDESVLTEKGRLDAEKVGEALRSIEIAALYCSPLQRAKTTAEVIGARLTHAPAIQPTEQLLEIDLPIWENMVKEEVKAQFPQEYRDWHHRPHEFKMILSGGQEHYPVLSLYQQAQAFWQNILPQHPGQTILIVAHNGINRCLLLSSIGIPVSLYHSIQQSNCCINVLNFTGDFGDPVQVESLNQTAHLGIALPPPRPPFHGSRLLLVRHGETQWNRDKRFQGIRDIPLNDNGQAQAQKAAEFLQATPIDYAVTSPLSRPQETAEIILQYHATVTLDTRVDLTEICHGLWEGKLEEDIEASFPGMLAAWKTAPEMVQMPEGENLQEVWDRAIACWEEIVKTYRCDDAPKTILVVAHDAINKVILCYLLGLQTANFWTIKQGNGAVSVIDYPEGAGSTPVLQAINITYHLGAGILDRTAAGAL